MTLKSLIFTAILLLWMAVSTYWYVCKIKNDCQKKEKSELLHENTKAENTVTLKVNIDLLSVESDKKYEEKLLKGFRFSGFASNSSELKKYSEQDIQFINDLKNYLQENSGRKLEIIGYTDNIGSELYNIELSRKRALFIKEKLLAQGILENQIIIKAEGENNPVANNQTESGRMQNRRVEVKLSEN